MKLDNYLEITGKEYNMNNYKRAKLIYLYNDIAVCQTKSRLYFVSQIETYNNKDGNWVAEENLFEQVYFNKYDYYLELPIKDFDIIAKLIKQPVYFEKKTK